MPSPRPVVPHRVIKRRRFEHTSRGVVCVFGGEWQWHEGSCKLNATKQLVLVLLLHMDVQLRHS